MADFIVMKDQTTNMLSVDELSQKDTDTIIYNVKNYYQYYFDNEINEIILILSSRNETYGLVKWFAQEGKIGNIRSTLYGELKNQSLYSGHKAFIEFCNPSLAELLVICDYQNDINKMCEFLKILNIYNKPINYDIAEKVKNMLDKYNDSLDNLEDKIDNQTVYYRISWYAKNIFDAFNKNVPILDNFNEDLFTYIYEDINSNRYSKYKYININNDLSFLPQILQEDPKESYFGFYRRNIIFEKLCDTTSELRKSMFMQQQLYHLNEDLSADSNTDQVAYLFNKIIDYEEDVPYILMNGKLYFSQLKYIIERLDLFKNVTYRKSCIDIISKYYRGSILKDETVLGLFNGILQNS